MSALYVDVYRYNHQKEKFLQSAWPNVFITTYIFIYITLGALASINSTRLHENSDGYIIILISAAVIFSVQPRKMFFIILLNHTFFLTSLFIFSKDPASFFVKQANPTLTAIISFAISYTFYSYKQKEFIHQAERKENEIHLQKLFHVNPYPLILTQVSSGRIIQANKKALDFYGLSADQLADFDVSTLYKNPEERTALLQEVIRLGSIKNYMMEQKKLSGETRWVMANCELIEYKNETCMLTGVTDITEIKKMENELAKHASTDMLTGIMNRRSGMDILQTALAKAQYEETEFTVCFIDVNNLKMVNDTYGHPEGDDLVLNVSLVIQGELTPSDVFFRFGGDEFIVIFFEKTPAEAQTIWENITRAFQTFNEAGKKPYLLSVSHGFYHYVSGMDVSVDDMIGQADKEMYEQKKKSKAGR